MPPALHKRRIQTFNLPTGRLAIASVLCSLLLAGCQSHSTQDDDDMRLSHRSDDRHYFTYDSARNGQPSRWGDQQQPSPLAHQDIWARMRAGFQLQHTEHPRVVQHRKRFANNPAMLRAVSKRSTPYIHYIVERLEEQNMPLELALLPIIESSYNPFAYSSAQAVGLWQFIPSTGQYYNLRQTRWYDGRRDITASTNAALRYLSYLHDLFNGDWLLALAAYNAGEGTVGKAIEANQRQGLPTDYWHLPLPQETRDYVPKLLAVSQLVMSPKNYGISLTPVANEPYFEVVRLNRRVNLAHAAKLAELDEEELYRLNPAFTKGVTMDGPKQLLVPADKAETLANNLARLAKQDPAAYGDQMDELPEPTLNWDIPKRMASRYGSSGQMKEVNQAIVREIQSTQALNDRRAQRVEHVLSPVGARVSMVSGVTMSIRTTTPTAAAIEKREATTTTPVRTYKVKPGENLPQISKNLKVSINDLRRWNPLPDGRLKPGQVLNLQAPQTLADRKNNNTKTPVIQVALKSGATVNNSKGNQQTKAAAATPSPKQQPVKAKAAASATVYKVKKGESIQQIAKRFNVQPKALQTWNPGTQQELKPGQMLTLYLPR